MPTTIPRVEKGRPGTLLDADRANQLIDAVNKLMNARVVLDPTLAPSQSRVAMSDTDAVLIVGTKAIR